MTEQTADVHGTAPAASPPSVPGALERHIITHLCEPLLPRIPARVHPNTISLITHTIAWATAGCAVASVTLPASLRPLFLLGAGIGTLLSMIGDCLDGMHARRTGQCSKLGEMMDHWLDAIVVPLTIAGIAVALQVPAWALTSLCVTAVMVYQAQLVLYHHTGAFIHPEPASGVEGQFGVAVAYAALAALFCFTPRQVAWLDIAIAIVSVAGVLVQLRCSWFYYPKLGAHIKEHVNFVGMLAALAALHLVGACDRYGFLIGVVAISFRISGTYVLATIVGRRFNGGDRGIYAILALAAALHFTASVAPMGIAVPHIAWAGPYLLALYAALRNGTDLARRLSQLTTAS